MFDTHERILQKLAESGQKEFTAAMVRQAMDKVEEEDIDSMYHDWLKHEEAETKEREQWRADEITLDRVERSHYEAEMQPTSWEEATDDLGDFPELRERHDLEMER